MALKRPNGRRVTLGGHIDSESAHSQLDIHRLYNVIICIRLNVVSDKKITDFLQIICC